MPHTPDVTLSAHRLTRRYGNTLAVAELDLELKRGEVLGLLGPNGAGKSTTMQMLTGNLAPSFGSIAICGIDLLEQPKLAKAKIGYLPETPPLYRELTVDEFLTFCGRLHKVARSELQAAVSEAKARCGLSDMGRRLIAHLSKGYQQRVGIAQAILHKPDVVILDEPTAGLDPNQIREIRALIRELSGKYSVILSTHILPEVEQTCESVIIISQGHVVARDSVENLTSRLRGSETVAVEVEPRSGELDTAVVQAKLEQVAGVSRVVYRDTKAGRSHFEVESLQGRPVRAELARAVVESGWNLNELRGVNLSLEDIFLQLTNTDQAASGGAK